MDQDIAEKFIEAIDNMSSWERFKLTMLCIGGIIIDSCRLVKYKIKEIFNHV